MQNNTTVAAVIRCPVAIISAASSVRTLRCYGRVKRWWPINTIGRRSPSSWNNHHRLTTTTRPG